MQFLSWLSVLFYDTNLIDLNGQDNPIKCVFFNTLFMVYVLKDWFIIGRSWEFNFESTTIVIQISER